MFRAAAAASAGLLGLLFVALSINLRRILRDPGHVARARETLGSMLSLLTVSILVLIPGQGTVPLGTELLLVGIALAVVSMRLQGRTIRLFGSEGAWRWVWRLMPLNVATLAVLLAGLTLVVGEFGGLYWLALTVVVYFLWAALNAWWLMVEAASGTS